MFDGKLVESDCVCHNHVSQAMAPLHFADAADSVNVIYDRPRKWMNSMERRKKINGFSNSGPNQIPPTNMF